MSAIGHRFAKKESIFRILLLLPTGWSDLDSVLFEAVSFLKLPANQSGGCTCGEIRRRYRWRAQVHYRLYFMDLSPVQIPRSFIEEDEWDADGFVIPSLEIEDADENKTNSPEADNSKLSVAETRKEEDIHLGDHGAPPTQSKEQVHDSSGRKQRFKLKLKEADRRCTGSGRENKVDKLRELVGGEKIPIISSKVVSPVEWLDPHCHESEFEKICHH